MTTVVTAAVQPPELCGETMTDHLNHAGTKIYLQVFTPELAKQWLDANVNNRRLSETDVDRLARDMENGNWVFIGDPIRRGVDGTLYDGQHRLEATVRSGLPQTFLVIDGLAADTKQVIDTGRRRQYGQNLSMRGEKNGPLVAATLRFLALWIEDQPVTANRYPSNSEMDKLLEENPTVRVSCELGAKTGQVLRCSPTAVSFAHFLCSLADSTQAHDFFCRLTDGAGLTLGHPALTLREKFIRAKTNSERLTTAEQAAMTIIAWNAWREGRSLSKIYLPKLGLSNDSFPKAK